MGKKLIQLTLCAFAMSMMVTALAQAAGDPTLIGWWKLDEGTGTTVLDSSGGGNDGTFGGAPDWIQDAGRTAVSFSGSADLIETPLIIPAMTLENGFTWAFWCKQVSDGGGANMVVLGNRYGGTASPLQFIKFTPTRFEYYNTDHAGTIDYEDIPADEWAHLATVKNGADLQHYRNGVPTESNTATAENDENPFSMGGDATNGAEFWSGALSDVRLYNRALAEGEVLDVMAGKGPNAELAGDPVPESETTDVPRDIVLSWIAGEYAATHDVYLGTVLDDVNNATRANPLGVLVSEGQADTAYDPDGLLEIGQTYYWRVDEVNAAPDNTIFKGEVWTFTAEPLAYPIAGIVASTNTTSEEGVGIERTIDGSGLDELGQHSTTSSDMWLGTPGADPAQIEYTFDRVYKLHEMQVWNYNEMFEPILGFGVKDVTIEYTSDGAAWTVLGDVQFVQATAQPSYAANTIVDFGGAAVKAVRIAIGSGYGVLGQFGLSEVRFMFIPAHAREPQPADGETGVDANPVLGWRVGRDAISHEVYLSTDEAAVADGTALVDTVTEKSYAPDALDFGGTYYWRIDEVQDAETWAGDVWSFATVEYAVIDDMESYNDDDNAIFDTWIDGFVNDTGSTVGYFEAPFAEKSIVNSGSQSMPLEYANDAAPFYSEAERDLGNMNLDTNGADSLRLFVAGQADNAAEPLYLAVEDTSGNVAVATHPDANITTGSEWTEWVIPFSDLAGVNLGRVSMIYVGVGDRDNPSAGGTGLIFIDDIGYGHLAAE